MLFVTDFWVNELDFAKQGYVISLFKDLQMCVFLQTKKKRAIGQDELVSWGHVAGWKRVRELAQQENCFALLSMHFHACLSFRRPTVRSRAPSLLPIWKDSW